VALGRWVGWRSRRRLAAATVALVLLASGGCAEPAPPPAIAVRDAPANPPRFSLAKPGKGGLLPAARWPKACDLISDDDVQAILPGASRIDHYPQTATIEVSDHIGLARSRQIEVPQRGCRIEFELPRAEGDDAAPAASRIQFDLDAVGTKKVAALNFQETGDVVEGSGAGECRRLADSRYHCRVKGVVFTLDGSVAPDLRFEGQRGEATTFYGRRVLHEFVKLVAAKL
jgi:hypothetical protein